MHARYDDGSVADRLRSGEGRRLSAAYCDKCGRTVASLHVIDGQRWLLTAGGRYGSARLMARDTQTYALNLSVEAAHPRLPGDDALIGNLMDAARNPSPAQMPGLALDVDWVTDEIISQAVDAGSAVEFPAVCPGCRQMRLARMTGRNSVEAAPWPYALG